eukprot:7002652-Alexandrium_andersonii.AAC.1
MTAPPPLRCPSREATAGAVRRSRRACPPNSLGSGNAGTCRLRQAWASRHEVTGPRQADIVGAWRWQWFWASSIGPP